MRQASIAMSWVAEQKAAGYGQSGKHEKEAAWLFDWKGNKLKTVMTDSYNTSGFAVGNGHLWMGANGGPNGIYEVDMNGKTLTHRPIPLGGGGCHGLTWKNGKLWIVSNRLRGILRVDPKSWTPEFMIPFGASRWHGSAWDDSHPGGAMWMITGTSEVRLRRRRTSMPSIRGIFTSRIARSGGSASSPARPDAPSK